jgi:hypothetical protein
VQKSKGKEARKKERKKERKLPAHKLPINDGLIKVDTVFLLVWGTLNNPSHHQRLLPELMIKARSVVKQV